MVFSDKSIIEILDNQVQTVGQKAGEEFKPVSEENYKIKLTNKIIEGRDYISAN